jgi:integrase/recombinase XerC
MFDHIVHERLAAAQRRPDLAESTKVAYARVACHLVAWPSARDDEVAVAEFVAARPAAGAAPRTVALDLRVLSAATHWAHRHLGAPHPPVLPRIRIDPRVFVLDHGTPTPAEAAAALRAMPRDEWQLTARIVAATGARVGEVVQLRSVDLDLGAGRLALGAAEGASKTGMRWFPLDAATLRALDGREGRGREPLLEFGGVDAPIQALQRRLRRACDRAGVPRFTPHGLRRMEIGRLLRAGVDPATAASLTGHSIDVMLKHYHEVTDEDRRLAAERAMLGVLDELPRER